VNYFKFEEIFDFCIIIQYVVWGCIVIYPCTEKTYVILLIALMESDRPKCLWSVSAWRKSYDDFALRKFSGVGKGGGGKCGHALQGAGLIGASAHFL